ncbi:MAG: transposase [bacterium]|nr:transposase [bacterium]
MSIITTPGFQHFTHFIVAHAALWGARHCVTETLRATLWHHVRHWTTPYCFMKRGRWSCCQLSRRLLDLALQRLALAGPLVLAIDDTLVRRWGRHFDGLGLYPNPTDKNPGAARRKVWGHCWVMMALLWEKARGVWFCFPLAARLFIPQRALPTGWAFQTKIELAAALLERLELGRRQVIVLVDNLYAKARLAWRDGQMLVSRLRSNAALYELPGPRPKGQRGRRALRGQHVTAQELWRRRSQRRTLKVHIYGKWMTIEAFVGVLMPSRTLGGQPILAVIFPQRSGKLIIFFSTNLTMGPVRRLELYAARFKIEDAFDELKTHGMMGDCRERGFLAKKRHVTLCLTAYSLLRLLSVSLAGAERIETEPWWHPAGPPSVTRLRRVVAKALGISCGLRSAAKHKEIPTLPLAA